MAITPTQPVKAGRFDRRSTPGRRSKDLLMIDRLATRPRKLNSSPSQNDVIDAERPGATRSDELRHQAGEEHGDRTAASRIAAGASAGSACFAGTRKHGIEILTRNHR
jgi:hypothetical protein